MSLVLLTNQNYNHLQDLSIDEPLTMVITTFHTPNLHQMYCVFHTLVNDITIFFFIYSGPNFKVIPW